MPRATTAKAAPSKAQGPNVGRDGLVFLLFSELLVLLVTGMLGAYQLFGVVLVMTIGTFVAVGFVRKRDALSWVPPTVSTLVLMAGLIGVLALEDYVVTDASSTVLGFHPSTAFLVYLIWLPGFFTLGLAYTLAFDRLYGFAVARKAASKRQEATP